MSSWAGIGKKALHLVARATGRLPKGLPTRLLILTLAWQVLPAGAQPSAPGENAPGSPQPFEARYQLQTQGWPKATVTHRLSAENGHWLSDMSLAVAVARASERSRFTVQVEDVQALQYSGSYALLGIGKEYQLGGEELTLPDRQTALFALSRLATQDSCRPASPCDIRYLDHRGDSEHFHYYPISHDTLSLPAGEFDAVTVALVNPEKPDRMLHISFHPRLPGLLLRAEYRRDGRQHTRLSLLDVSLPGGIAP